MKLKHYQPDTIGGKFLNMEQMRLRSLYYYKRSIEIRDTLFSQENKKQMVRNEMNYEFDKKETATKAEQDSKDAVTVAEKNKQQFVLILVSCVLLLVFLFAGFIFRSLRITRKQKQIIEVKSRETEEQKKVIEEKQKEILDSINYAKRIQRAMLPHRRDIWTEFPHNTFAKGSKRPMRGIAYLTVIANGRTTVPKTNDRPKFKHRHKDKPF